MNTRSHPLDLLRTLAIFLVFLSHFHQFAKDLWFGRLAEFGWVGVDLFFVLSGFLISSQLFKEIQKTGTISLKEFYIRRGFRIWPNFFFVLALYFFFPAIAERSQLAPLWRYLSFTQNFGLDYTATGAFSHAWSLCVEEQFYVVLPIILILFFPRFTRIRTIAFISTIFLFGIWIRGFEWHRWQENFYYVQRLKYYGKEFYTLIYYPTHCRLDSLAMGVTIAAAIQFCPQQWEKLKKFGDAFLMGALVVLLGSYFITQDEYSLLSSRFGYILNAFAFGLLLLAALSPSGLLSRFRGKWAVTTANLAFAFYLTHKAIIHHASGWLLSKGLDPGSTLYPILILIACMVISALLLNGIEKPFLKWRDRVLHSRSLHFNP